MKYAAIEVHRAQFSVRLMCRVLGVSRAGFYASGKRAVSARAKRDEELRTQIRAVSRAAALMAARASMPSCTRKASDVAAKEWPA